MTKTENKNFNWKLTKIKTENRIQIVNKNYNSISNLA